MTNSTVLLEFFFIHDEFYTFVITPNEEQPLVLKSKIQAKEIENIVAKLQEELAALRSKSEIDKINIDYFYDLGRKIFTQELYQIIKDYEGIYLVPFKGLHQLPIHAFLLPNGNSIIDEFIIAYLPSASILKYLKYQDKHLNQPEKKALLVGVDARNDEAIFKLEVQRIAEKLEKIKVPVDLKLAKSATKMAISSELFQHNILHFSTHGYFSTPSIDTELYREQSKSLIHILKTQQFQDRISLKPSTIDVASNAGLELYNDFSDNRLTVRDITNSLLLSENTMVELFVTTACLTARTKNKLGDELLGISRSLLHGGVCSMIVTLFEVYKKVTTPKQKSSLAKEWEYASFFKFYDLWLKENYTKAKAFQEYIKGIKNNTKYKHPFFWFSYIYIGII